MSLKMCFWIQLICSGGWFSSFVFVSILLVLSWALYKCLIALLMNWIGFWIPVGHRPCLSYLCGIYSWWSYWSSICTFQLSVKFDVAQSCCNFQCWHAVWFLIIWRCVACLLGQCRHSLYCLGFFLTISSLNPFGAWFWLSCTFWCCPFNQEVSSFISQFEPLPCP